MSDEGPHAEGVGRTVTVTYHTDKGVWWADSPDVPGFSAGDHSLHDLRPRVADALRFFLERDDLDIREQHADGRKVVEFNTGDGWRVA